MNSAPVLENIHRALATGDAQLLRECVWAIARASMDINPFPEEYLEIFLDLLNQKKFLELGGAWYFIMLFGTKWQYLPNDQQQKVLPALQIAHEAFKQISPELIAEAIKQAINSGEEMQMKECASAIARTLSTLNYFPEPYFKLILDFLNQQRFLESNGSWHLLFVVEGDWELLSECQKDRLLPSIETSYGCFSDWMSRFVITELLGEKYADERAFEVLCRLKGLAEGNKRALVAHGLEHIVTDSNNEDLARKAYTELVQMKNDPSEQVRDEVETSLQRIANKKVKFD
jgi:hypothetical protein